MYSCIIIYYNSKYITCNKDILKQSVRKYFNKKVVNKYILCLFLNIIHTISKMSFYLHKEA